MIRAAFIFLLLTPPSFAGPTEGKQDDLPKPYDLTLSYRRGEKFTSVIEIKAKSAGSKGAASKLDVKIEAEIAWEVTKVTDEGIATLKGKFVKLKCSGTGTSHDGKDTYKIKIDWKKGDRVPETGFRPLEIQNRMRYGYTVMTGRRGQLGRVVQFSNDTLSLLAGGERGLLGIPVDLPNIEAAIGSRWGRSLIQRRDGAIGEYTHRLIEVRSIKGQPLAQIDASFKFQGIRDVGTFTSKATYKFHTAMLQPVKMTAKNEIVSPNNVKISIELKVEIRR